MQEKTFQTFTEDFIFHCRYEKNLSNHTLKAYRQDLKQFAAYLTGKGPVMGIEEIDKHILRDYLRQLTARNKVKTVKRKIATLKAFFGFLEFEDRIVVSPFRKMRVSIREPLVLPSVLTLPEVTRLFRAAYRVRQQCPCDLSYAYKAAVRDIVVLELLFATGIRVSELCHLEKDNVNLVEKYILVRGKGNKERLIQICSSEIIEILEEYIELFHVGSDPIVNFFINRFGQPLSDQSVRVVVKKYAQLAEITRPITPHMFRHTFATLLLEEEVDIRYIQHLLGHSTITTTQIYTHITLNKQKEILTTRHPRGGLRVVN